MAKANWRERINEVMKRRENSNLKKDPYSVKDYEVKELQEMYRIMIDREVYADQHSGEFDASETNGIDWELYKQAIENEFKRRGVDFTV